MKIKFDTFEIAHSPLHEAGKSYLRPVMVNPQTIPTSDIMKKTSEECTLTPIDISAVIGSLAHHLRLQLLQGNAVHINGIGTFSLALRFDNPAKANDDITARDVQVSGINFTPDSNLLATVKSNVSFERTSAGRSTAVTEGDAILALREYFKDYQSISKRTFQTLLGLKYGRATKLLTALTEKHKLTVSRVGPTNIYHPGATL